ncbi:ribonuclease HI family protein [Candidatus Bathyarchaeota archaeon]|nr:ribonuclease HI family protein [Candidatus Bathyarchaeota archaeon]
MRQLWTYSDGASRGNPGPAAVAIKIVDENGVVAKKFSKFLGRKTNNQAEYEALIEALQLAHDFTKGYVHCFLDSELIVKQLNGEYQVRNPRLEVLWLKVRELQQHFQSVSFNHISRTDKNMKEVDASANRVLDSILG